MRLAFRKIVIGATRDLKVSFVDAESATGELYDLEAASAEVTVTIWPKGLADDPTVDDGECTVSGTDAFYRWDTTGLDAGVYCVRFTVELPSGASPHVEPPDPIEVRLVA